MLSPAPPHLLVQQKTLQHRGRCHVYHRQVDPAYYEGNHPRHEAHYQRRLYPLLVVGQVQSAEVRTHTYQYADACHSQQGKQKTYYLSHTHL